MGQKKSRKIPSKFPTKLSKFPYEKSKRIHRRASAGAQEEHIVDTDEIADAISVRTPSPRPPSREVRKGFLDKAFHVEVSSGIPSQGDKRVGGRGLNFLRTSTLAQSTLPPFLRSHPRASEEAAHLLLRLLLNKPS